MTPHRSSVALLAAAAAAVLVMGCAAGPATPPAPTAADAKAFLDTVNQTMLKLGVLREPGGLGRAELHHRRHRSAQRADQPAVHRRHRAVREGLDALRQAGPAGRPAPADDAAQDVARDGHAVGSEGGRRADDDHGAARSDVRQGQVVPRLSEARRLPEHRRHHEGDGHVARPEAAARGVGRLAHDFAADEEGLRALRRAVEQGRARSSGSPTPARCGARSTTCRPTTSRRSWIGSGSRCGRSIVKLHAYVRMKLHDEVRRSRAGRPARFRRICSATSGRRTGRTSIRSWPRRTRTRATR